jgi:hypothetical protein
MSDTVAGDDTNWQADRVFKDSNAQSTVRGPLEAR